MTPNHCMLFMLGLVDLLYCSLYIIVYYSCWLVSDAQSVYTHVIYTSGKNMSDVDYTVLRGVQLFH